MFPPRQESRLPRPHTVSGEAYRPVAVGAEDGDPLLGEIVDNAPVRLPPRIGRADRDDGGGRSDAPQKRRRRCRAAAVVPHLEEAGLQIAFLPEEIRFHTAIQIASQEGRPLTADQAKNERIAVGPFQGVPFASLRIEDLQTRSPDDQPASPPGVDHRDREPLGQGLYAAHHPILGGHPPEPQGPRPELLHDGAGAAQMIAVGMGDRQDVDPEQSHTPQRRRHYAGTAVEARAEDSPGVDQHAGAGWKAHQDRVPLPDVEDRHR